jgi:CubicO group peptidase (beta-lactamase class C family)
MESSSPSAQGVDARGIAAFVDDIEADPRVEPHGLIIHRHGTRIAEGWWAPHGPGRSRLVYSLSKSFTGTALALALGDGLLSLDDLVSDHLPDLFDGVDEGSAAWRMKVRHIASMATGHDHETFLEALALDPEDPVRGFLRIPPEAEPGTLFVYNQPPVMALSTILQRLTGHRLLDQLRRRVLDPIGVGDLRWAQLGNGVDMGFSGVYTNLDAIARLGQLYLDDGVWDGRRLLPEGWVAQASSVQIPNPQREEPDWRQGYGFQLWMAQHGYRGDGAFGQYMVVLPEHDAVVAMFSCTEDMQVVLDLMWEHLLPAFADGAATSPAADEALAARLCGLSLRTAGDALDAGPPDVPAMTFTPAGREALTHPTVTSIDAVDGRLVIHEGERSISAPLTSAWSVVEPTLAASAARLADGTVTVELCFLETPHRLVIDLHPADATFDAWWPTMPLFAAGLDNRLTSLVAPAAP